MAETEVERARSTKILDEIKMRETSARIHLLDRAEAETCLLSRRAIHTLDLTSRATLRPRDQGVAVAG